MIKWYDKKKTCFDYGQAVIVRPHKNLALKSTVGLATQLESIVKTAY